PGVSVSVNVRVATGSVQLSVTVGSPRRLGSSSSSHSTGMSDGRLTAGGVSWETAIVWVQLALLPQSSVAVHVRGRVEASAQAPMVGGGHVASGVVCWETVRAWVQLVLLPQSPVAVYARSLREARPIWPGVSVSVNGRVATGSVQLSVTVGSPRRLGSSSSSHSTWMSAGQLIASGVSSATAMVWAQVLLLPQSSVAVHVRVRV